MSKPHGTKDFWLAGLRAEAAAFAAAASQDGVLDLTVPSCPDWKVCDLVFHVGRLYEWVCTHVDRGVSTPPEPTSWRDFQTDRPEATGRPVVEWWTERYEAMAAMLDGLDPDLPAWNWAPQPKRAGFWHRRMAHETAVHRWDAQMATGLAEPIEARLASDGLTEVLDTWLPSGRRHRRDGRQGMVALHATDLDEVWYVRLRGEGIALLDTDTLLDDDDHHERATASGSASDLLLAAYGRVPFDVLQVTGEMELLEGLRTG